jgi:hypothetical protein
VSNFYSLLTELINKHVPVEFQGVHKVVYQNKQEKWNGVNWGISPALIKEPAFIKQKEPITPSRAGGLVGNRQRRL